MLMTHVEVFRRSGVKWPLERSALVIQAFQQEHARRRGQVSAEVISAIALDDNRKIVVEKTVARLLVATRCYFRCV